MDGKVTQKQEIFCQEWLDNVGNGTLAALIAFDITDKELLKQEEPKDKAERKEYYRKIKLIENTASAMSTEYLRKPHIIKRIDDILEERGFNDDAVKREHFKLIKNGDETVKMRAIDSYYKLKGKFIDRTDITSGGEPIDGFNFVKNETDNKTNKKATDSVGLPIR